MHAIEIHEIEPPNHNVKRIVTDKPEGFGFKTPCSFLREL